MALLANATHLNPSSAYYLPNNGTPTAPSIIASGDVTIQSTGADVDVLANGDFTVLTGDDVLVSAGGEANIGVANNVCGVVIYSSAATETNLTGRTGATSLAFGVSPVVAPNALAISGTGIATAVPVSVGNNQTLTIPAGSSLSFANLSAPRGTFRGTGTVAGNAFPNGVRTAITNPVGIVEGLYSITHECTSIGGDATGAKGCLGTVAYWTGTVWQGGGCFGVSSGGGNMALFPADNRSTMTGLNTTGGDTVGSVVRFVQLAGSAV